MPTSKPPSAKRTPAGPVKQKPTAAPAASAAAPPTAKAVNVAANPIIYHGSLLLNNLPVDYKKVYMHTVRRFFSPAQERFLPKEVNLVEEIGNATLCVEVANKTTAQLLHKQLQNRKVFGRRWKVQYVPVTALECSAEACLVDCYLIPAASPVLAERALSGIPGFLSFIDTPEEPLLNASARAAASPIQDADNDSNADGDADQDYNDGEVRHKLLVSFADEGSALHARAVLSGRLVGTTGVRMFLERRKADASK